VKETATLLEKESKKEKEPWGFARRRGFNAEHRSTGEGRSREHEKGSMGVVEPSPYVPSNKRKKKKEEGDLSWFGLRKHITPKAKKENAFKP